MDAARQIRFHIPTFFFFASVLSAAVCSPMRSEVWCILRDLRFEGLASMIAAIGITALPIGFFISAITTLTLRFGFWICESDWFYQFETGERQRVKNAMHYSSEPPDVILPARWETVAFDHDVLHKDARGLHEWIMRTWSFSAASSNSVTALIASFLMVKVLKIHPYPGWWAMAIFVLLVLIANSYVARQDARSMIRFQTYRRIQNERTNGRTE